MEASGRGREAQQEQVGGRPDGPAASQRHEARGEASEPAERPSLGHQGELQDRGEHSGGEGHARAGRSGRDRHRVPGRRGTVRRSRRPPPGRGEWNPAPRPRRSACPSAPTSPRAALLPGQSSHQKAIIAITGRANVVSGARICRDVTAPPAAKARTKNSGTTNVSPARPTRGWRSRGGGRVPGPGSGALRAGWFRSGGVPTYPRTRSPSPAGTDRDMAVPGVDAPSGAARSPLCRSVTGTVPPCAGNGGTVDEGPAKGETANGGTAKGETPPSSRHATADTPRGSPERSGALEGGHVSSSVHRAQLGRRSRVFAEAASGMALMATSTPPDIGHFAPRRHFRQAAHDVIGRGSCAGSASIARRRSCTTVTLRARGLTLRRGDK